MTTRTILTLMSATALVTASAAGLRAQEPGIGVGKKAPVVAVHDLDGKTVDLSQYIGKKPVFLEFWATWCTNCQELLPAVRAAQGTYGKKVEFIGINITVNQSPERVRQYLETHRPPYRTLYDDEGTSTRAYEVPATSYVVIIDQSGTVVYTGLGGSQKFDGPLRQVTQN